MATHTNEQFTRIVDMLNLMFKDKMTFQLVGSLAEKPASYHDADIVVYPQPAFPPGIALEGFIRGCTVTSTPLKEVSNEVRQVRPYSKSSK